MVATEERRKRRKSGDITVSTMGNALLVLRVHHIRIESACSDVERLQHKRFESTTLLTVPVR